MSKKQSVCFTAAFLLLLLLSAFLFRLSGQEENTQFCSYTAALFRQQVSSDSVTLHYTLKDPSAYGIHKMPDTLGSFDVDAGAIAAASENALAVLHSFERRRLSEENRRTYDVIEASLNHSLALSRYHLFREPLAPLTGTQAQLPVILSEYRFYRETDCEAYLDLLAKMPDYFRSVIAFEKARADAGLFMSDSNVDAILKECEDFLKMGDSNYLYTSFEDRLQSLNLPDVEKAAYMEKNKKQITTYVFPAYRELADALKQLKGAGKNEYGLCYFPEGKRYYEALVASETGSSRSIRELKALTTAQMAEDSAMIRQTLAPLTEDLSSSSDLFRPQGTFLETTDPAAILKDLESCLSGAFPAPPKVTTEIKYVQKSMEEYLSPAFYMIPPIDGFKDNVIYINRGHLPDDLTLFTTLAHEGYPGHLYQTTYFASTDPDPIRNLMNFGGYTEGWATYTEMLSYYYASLPKEQAVILQRNASIVLGLYALADIGIHYDGWTLTDTMSFFREYGITDVGTIGEIYHLILAAPANYLKYYIGYVEFLELKKLAIQTWGDDFTQKDFHRLILDAGPAPFDVLKQLILGADKPAPADKNYVFFHISSLQPAFTIAPARNTLAAIPASVAISAPASVYLVLDIFAAIK